MTLARSDAEIKSIAAMPAAVEVLGEQRVAGLDAAILKASDTEALAKWLRDQTRTPIALNESVERRLLDLEASALEFMWRREEQLARIIDQELTPRRLLEAHLRRLPVRLRPRRAAAARLLADVEGN